MVATISSAENATRRTKDHGLWKLNVSVSSKERYEHAIRKLVNNAILDPIRHEDVGLWWERVFKPGVKRVTINYCIQRARD